MTHAIVHSLNIGTLATWLSVVGFGVVGVIVPQWHPSPVESGAVEITIADRDFTLGETGQPGSTGETDAGVPPENAVALPAPPDLPPMAALDPLPEIPELPAPAVRFTENAPARESSARRETGRKETGIPQTTPRRSGGGGVSSSSGISSASRLAAGSMPAPSYPAEARRKGQDGTVVVEFTVDSSGRVISAYAKFPSPWPLLNNEAVRTVRRWKFPPGGVMKLQRPIVFQLR
jgi:protein TonB